MLAYKFSPEVPHVYVGMFEYDTNSSRSLETLGATTVAPPITNPNEVAVFDLTTKTWSIVSDFSKEQGYFKSSGSPAPILRIGEALPSNVTLVAPATTPATFDDATQQWQPWSAEEVNAAMKADYMVYRAAAYPPLEDLADALVHQANGDGSHLQAYFDACLAIKQKYPKV